MWAAFNLRTARMGERIAAELRSGSAGVARVRAVFHDEWDVLEIGAMSLAFEDVMTALDLCANAVYLASGGTPTADGAYKDLGFWTPRRLVKLPSNTQEWLLALQVHPDMILLDHCRTELAHRAVQRHVIRGAGALPPHHSWRSRSQPWAGIRLRESASACSSRGSWSSETTNSCDAARRSKWTSSAQLHRPVRLPLARTHP